MQTHGRQPAGAGAPQRTCLLIQCTACAKSVCAVLRSLHSQCTMYLILSMQEQARAPSARPHLLKNPPSAWTTCTHCCPSTAVQRQPACLSQIHRPHLRAVYAVPMHASTITYRTTLPGHCTAEPALHCSTTDCDTHHQPHQPQTAKRAARCQSHQGTLKASPPP